MPVTPPFVSPPSLVTGNVGNGNLDGMPVTPPPAPSLACEGKNRKRDPDDMPVTLLFVSSPALVGNIGYGNLDGMPVIPLSASCLLLVTGIAGNENRVICDFAVRVLPCL